MMLFWLMTRGEQRGYWQGTGLGLRFWGMLRARLRGRLGGRLGRLTRAGLRTGARLKLRMGMLRTRALRAMLTKSARLPLRLLLRVGCRLGVRLRLRLWLGLRLARGEAAAGAMTCHCDPGLPHGAMVREAVRQPVPVCSWPLFGFHCWLGFPGVQVWRTMVLPAAVKHLSGNATGEIVPSGLVVNCWRTLPLQLAMWTVFPNAPASRHWLTLGLTNDTAIGDGEMLWADDGNRERLGTGDRERLLEAKADGVTESSTGAPTGDGDTVAE
jgi:hypothetical protein